MTDLHRKEIEIKKEQFQELVAELHSPLNRTGLSFKIWIGFLLLLMATAAFMYVRQLRYGLGTTDMRDIASWGLYIADFVFLIAVSLVGSLITAILKLSNIKWATPLTRISEIIAVAALFSALLIIVVDMGRPDRLWHIFVYGRLQSPIVWDILVVNTYLVISLLLLYIPLIPDIALLRKTMGHKPKWQQKMYKILSLGWQGTADQVKVLNLSLKALMVVIIPVALSIHTVTSWLFASTLRPGWDSTIFGPYFVAGAFMVGAATVIVTMYIIREAYHFKEYITDEHFNLMGKLLVLTSLVYLYFNLNEFMVPAYKMKSGESAHILGLLVGDYSLMFWSVQVIGMIAPIFLMAFKPFRKPKPMLVISVLIVIAAFLKRFLIVTPTLLHPFLPIQNYPESYHHYNPTFSEMMITVGSIAGIALVISIFTRLFPIIPVSETAHEKGFPNEIINNS
ncbi:MAG: NrfD/PsrC family molybdoenzyme membrane anchor subunit [Bacteroidota bacterium]|nr:polysulfide reductase [Odoribacter sp.]MDP3642069.1 NrfD/PsrC family molybdoenzyme membrane anchor subunit [Bacteroidota bacterium]